MEQTQDTIDRSLETLVRVGRVWALHGLGVGRSALRASAETLRGASDLLAALSEAVEGADGSHRTDPTVPRADASTPVDASTPAPSPSAG